MTFRTLLLTVAVCLLSFAATPTLHAEGIAPAEKAKIEALLSHLETLKDATFVRNGSTYDSKTAGKFLRRKWAANEKEINSAADFILKAGTGSSTSGKPYLVRINGVDIPCADYLTAQVKKLGPPAAAK